MYEFEIVNVETNEHRILIGRNFDRVMERNGLSTKDWILIMQELLYESYDL